MAVLESLKDSSILLVTLPSNFASQHPYKPKKKKNQDCSCSTTNRWEDEALNLNQLWLGINLFVNYKVLKLNEIYIYIFPFLRIEFFFF